jgi:hypothetical protein
MLKHAMAALALVGPLSITAAQAVIALPTYQEASTGNVLLIETPSAVESKIDPVTGTPSSLTHSVGYTVTNNLASGEQIIAFAISTIAINGHGGMSANTDRSGWSALATGRYGWEQYGPLATGDTPFAQYLASANFPSFTSEFNAVDPDLVVYWLSDSTLGSALLHGQTDSRFYADSFDIASDIVALTSSGTVFHSSAVPEPESAALALAGLGLVCLWTSLRKKSA